jgi:hypothetical protein
MSAMSNAEVEQAIAECTATINADATAIEATCERVFRLPRLDAAFVAAQVQTRVIGARWNATRKAFLGIGL